MALTVGELTASLTVDDSAVDPGLRRAEQAMRSTGEQMGDDAERAGQQAGENLGEGLVRGADGRIRDINGRFVRAVRQAGDDATTAARTEGENTGEAFGDGLSDGAQQGGENAATAAQNGLEKVKVAAAGVGLAAGALLMDSMAQAMEQSKITARLGAQLGATPAEAEKYGHIAGQLYSKAITEDFQGAADAISAVMGSGLLKPDATNAQIQSISTKVADLANTFDQDLGGVTNAVSQLMRTGLAKSADEAFDLISAGFGTSANKGDDFLETLNEYSVQFKRVGLDGKTAIGLIDQAIKAGARDSDQVADAIGQFGEKALAGGTAVEAAFKSIGLDADDVAAKLRKGGKSGQEALQMTTDALRGQKDETTKLNAATALFGDPGTVMGDALFALDPAGAAAASGMDKAAGATGRLGDTLHDNAGTRLEAFKRGMQQNLIDFLGGTVIPGLETFRDRVGGVFGRMWSEAGKGSEGTADRIISFFGLLAQKVGSKLAEQVPKAIEGLMNFGGKIADFVAANPEKVLKIGLIAAAIVLAIVALPITVGAALSAAVAMIMIGFVRNLITGLNDNLPKWWQSFKDWVSAKAGEAGSLFTAVGLAIGVWFGGLWSRYIGGPVSRAWSSFITSVRALPGRTLAALAALGSILATVSGNAWQRFKDGASRKGTEFVSWVRGLPGRAKSALGNVGSILLAAGGSLIQGFITGIKNKIGQVRSAASSVVSAAREYFPFSPAKKGPFSGRGYTTYSGQALMAGFAQGIRNNTGQVGRALNGIPGMPDAMADSTMAGLFTTPTPGEMAASRTAGSAATGGTGDGRIVTLRGGDAWGDMVIETIRDRVGIGGGDVQVYLGK